MPKQPERIFTLRALLVGSIGAFIVSAGTAYGALYLKGSLMSTGTSMPGAVFVLFLITLLVNPALKLISPRAGLRRGELLLVYVMLVMASPLPRLFVYKFICSLTYPFYYATPENDWRNIVLPHLPDWIVPHSPELVQLFFEGVAQGQAIPWGPWLRVFAAWMPFIWALFLVMIASMVIMRRQWVENERLIFPLLQVPLAMVGEDGDKGRLGRFYKDPVMWAGFAVPALYGTLHGLYNYFPGIVAVATRVDPIHFTLPVFDGVHDLYFLLRFNILGFFYFLKTDIAFSIWFFNLLSFVARGVFARLGIGITETGMVATEDVGHAVPDLILAYQAMGGMLALFFGGLWMGRTHLKAFSARPSTAIRGRRQRRDPLLPGRRHHPRRRLPGHGRLAGPRRSAVIYGSPSSSSWGSCSSATPASSPRAGSPTGRLRWSPQGSWPPSSVRRGWGSRAW